MERPLALYEAGDTALRTLARMSARLGSDPLLVQASTGNTSWKTGRTLWIKGSGKWLRDAEADEIFAQVDLDDVLARLHLGQDLPASHATLRPSIETFMHAVLPWHVVIHVHAVNALSAALRADAVEFLGSRLRHLRWELIPYQPSGAPLAIAIAQAIANNPGANVFILRNHGLVVCGNDCAEAESLVRKVETLLAAPPRVAPRHRHRLLEQIQRLSAWRVPQRHTIHCLGTDPVTRRIIRAGVLYPCQALFLGRTLPFLSCSQPLSPRTDSDRRREAPFLIVEGCGVVLSSHITAAEYATLEGFAAVVQRLQPSAPLQYLNSSDVDCVLQAEAAYGYKLSCAKTLPRTA